MAELPDGWDIFFGDGGFNTLLRLRDRANIRASVDPSLWARQITDFEFAEGAQWTAEQAATIASRERVVEARSAIDPALPIVRDVVRVRHPDGLETISGPLPVLCDDGARAGRRGPVSVGSTCDIHGLWTREDGVFGCPSCQRVEPPRVPCDGRLGHEWQSAFEDEDIAKVMADGPPRTWLSVQTELVALSPKAPWIGFLQEDQMKMSVADSPSADIPVTPEMIAAGLAAFQDGEDEFKPSDVVHLYRAMAALAPVELIPEGELRAVRERDAARGSMQFWKETAATFEVQRDEALVKWQAARDALIGENVALKELAAVRADAEGLKAHIFKQAELFQGACERIGYFEDYVANMPNVASVKEMLAARDATIADLNAQLACRPPAVMHVPASVGTEVRPAPANDGQPLHWVQSVLTGEVMAWTWLPTQGCGGRWIWADPNATDEVNGYSGLAGFNTGPQAAYSEGWRYLGVAQFTATVARADSTPAHDPFRPVQRDPRRMGPEGI